MIFFNFLSQAIEKGISAGIPEQYFAYLLILPLLASLIAASRHLLGLTTHGTFLTVILAAVWVEVGLWSGLVIFSFLMIWAFFSHWLVKKTLVKKFKVNYLPRMAILLLLVSLGTLFLGLFPNWFLTVQTFLDILPFLVLTLLVHSLLEAQINLSKKESRSLLMETVFFAFAGFLLLSWPTLQRLVLAYPLLTIAFAFVFNLYIGRYVGFRLLEYSRFKSVIDD